MSARTGFMSLGLIALSFSIQSFAQTPGPSAKARMATIDQHLEAWDLEAAEAEIEQLKQETTVDRESIAYFEGRIAFERGDYAKALDDLKQAGLDDKPGSWLRLVSETISVVGRHEQAESEHFILRYPKGKDSILVPWALSALEKIRAGLLTDLGYAPPGKVRVEIISTASELSKVSTLSKEAIRTTGTIAICKFNKLMVTSPKAVIKGYDWIDTIAHEYTHLIVSRKSHNTVPIWLHEGLAKYLESRWRGTAGLSMTPSTLALLGSRVRKGAIVPFEKMHPSMALLPTAEDAATAFAEVFFAIDFIARHGGPHALSRLVNAMADGHSDRRAVEIVLKKPFAEFEKAWMAHVKSQPFPRDLIPPSSNEKKQLTENVDKPSPKKKHEISFGDFAEVKEPTARRAAHLGEIFRERNRHQAAAETFDRAHREVGNRYESVSNKYALALLELRKFDTAAKVLEGSLEMHPHSASTNVHLGRIRLRAKDYDRARAAYLNAVAVNPFDPEVHVALLALSNVATDTELKARALPAVKSLLGLSERDASLLAEKFLHQDDLTNVDWEPRESSNNRDGG